MGEPNPRRWSIVLAGGDGQRMRPFIERWLGGPRPKQYCAFTGRRTMLEHALDSALSIAPPERVVTVVDRLHRPYLAAPRPIRVPGRLLEQPRNLDTGPGILLPLAAVLARDPDAVVAILPSDHFIHPRERFHELLDEACGLAEALPSQIVLLGAPADRPETDYGWLQPGDALRGRRASFVRAFREKPDALQAERFHADGFVWNTMIIAAKAQSLWRLAWALHPQLMTRFERVSRRMGAPDEREALDEAYAGMSAMNFSRGILERAADWCVVLPMTGVRWCDWGQPERVLEGLRFIGRDLAAPGLPVPLAAGAPAFSRA